jgi:hypothetical protein
MSLYQFKQFQVLAFLLSDNSIERIKLLFNLMSAARGNLE